MGEKSDFPPQEPDGIDDMEGEEEQNAEVRELQVPLTEQELLDIELAKRSHPTRRRIEYLGPGKGRFVVPPEELD